MWDWAFWNIITEWLRPQSDWMLFWVIWRRWSQAYQWFPPTTPLISNKIHIIHIYQRITRTFNNISFKNNNNDNNNNKKNQFHVVKKGRSVRIALGFYILVWPLPLHMQSRAWLLILLIAILQINSNSLI